MKLSASILACLLAVAVVISPVLGDCYGHSPRFSNGRLNNGATNRLFDSQNNGGGGYQWGPTMTYYSGSILPIEWTTQHSCGSENAECNIILQYMCSNANAEGDTLVRDGTTDTNIAQRGDDAPTAKDPTTGLLLYGMHEDQAYYKACRGRSRNKGLFIADQNIGDSAQSTRQNGGNGGNGYECTEERDYYPYWAPSVWKDIAVYTNNKGNCKMYQSNSQNVVGKNYCTGATTNNNLQPVMQQECLSAGGTWQTAPSFGLPQPACLAAPWGRDNHLGNGFNGGFHSYNWTLPTSKQESCINAEGGCSCVLRLRYNMSSADTTNWGSGAIDSTKNGASSPLKGDPNVMVSGNNFTLNVDTDQFARTFQDRTHTWNLVPRPKGVSAKAVIWNVGVRGKRGNIVDTFPAVEYDFVPQHLTLKVGEYIHFQWTGSETQTNNAAGQGRGSTDRSNIVQIKGAGYNYPIVDGQWGSIKPLFESEDARLLMSNIGQVDCPSFDQIKAQVAAGTANANDQVADNCFVLNKAPTGYFNGGLYKMNTTGDFHYMSSRNNQYSNRSQKALITVKPLLAAWQIALIVVGGVVVAAAGAAAGGVFYAKKNPHSGVARIIGKVPGLNRI